MKKFQVCFIIVLTVMSVFGLSFSFAQEGAGMDELDISLGELLNLDKVLVTATKHAMTARKAPAINSVITAAEIRNMGARDLADVLTKIPGLDTPKHATMERKVTVRGIATNYSEKVLLLIDGHRMNNAFEGSAFAGVCNSLLVENIKRIEVVRGPGSALYGANAFVGVINVITKTAEDVREQQISVKAGSFDTQHYNMLLGYKRDNFQISGHLDYFDTDGAALLIEEDYLTGRPGGLAPGDTNEWQERYDFGLNVTFGDFTLRARYIDVEKAPITGALAALNDESVFTREQGFGELLYAREVANALDLKIKLYADYHNNDTYWEILPEGFTGTDDQGMIGHPVLKNRTYGTELTMDYRIGDHLITAGFNYEDIEQYDVRHYTNWGNFWAGPVDVTENNNFSEEANRRVWAVYVQNIWEITEQDILTIGVRHDDYSDFGDTTNPRMGYVHEFDNRLVVKALYGSAFRAPNFVEMYSKNNPTVIGRKDLKPEKIETYELGVEYPFLKYFSAGLTYFYNEIEDMIGRGPLPETGPALYSNSTGVSRIRGIETELTANFGKERYGYINYSYQNGEDEDGHSFPFVAEWKINAGVNYPVFKYLNANLNFLWIGERGRPEGDPRDDVDSDTLVDLALIGKNFYKTLEITGTVHNVFDHDYRDPVPSPVITNDMPANPRTFMVEVRYKF